MLKWSIASSSEYFHFIVIEVLLRYVPLSGFTISTYGFSTSITTRNLIVILEFLPAISNAMTSNMCSSSERFLNTYEFVVR